MKVWVGREQMSDFYTLFRTKPRFDGGGFLEDKDGDYVNTFCEELFESFTGFKLKPGTCQRVEITINPAGPVRKVKGA